MEDEEARRVGRACWLEPLLAAEGWLHEASYPCRDWLMRSVLICIDGCIGIIDANAFIYTFAI